MEFYNFHLNFHVLGILLLLSPFIYDICQTVTNTYRRVRIESLADARPVLPGLSGNKSPWSTSDTVDA